ncbi:MAG: PadR family transcriptional regulator [Actinomycetaceae bacterium]|nr:PadR family transcriptional regulator [Arcanobacterium sp.]MDD7505183.1 PadR family transcriptional regulator [Actinomycetaceae bacterium]MDY6144082.1 PadR family transcriptional regulator [Arcanobacterium sp.]
MSVKHVLLMFLDQGPASVYQLKTAFENNTNNIWPMNIGQVYQTVQRLERDGLTEIVGEVNDTRPAPAYGITERGRSELWQWISQPVRRVPEARDELVMRIAVLANLEAHIEGTQGQAHGEQPGKGAPQDASSSNRSGIHADSIAPSLASLIHEQRMATIAQLREITRSLSHIPEQNLTAQLLAERHIFELEAEGRWLDHIEGIIAKARNRDALVPRSHDASTPSTRPITPQASNEGNAS